MRKKYVLKDSQKDCLITFQLDLKRYEANRKLDLNINVCKVNIFKHKPSRGLKFDYIVFTPLNHRLQDMLTESDLDTVFIDIISTINTFDGNRNRFFADNNLNRAMALGIVAEEAAQAYYENLRSIRRELKNITKLVFFDIDTPTYPNDCLVSDTIIAKFASEDTFKPIAYGLFPNREVADDYLVQSFMKNTHKLADFFKVPCCRFGTGDNKINKTKIESL